MKGSVERSSESSTEGLATEETSVDNESSADVSVEGSSESSTKCLEESSVIGSVKSSVGNS